MRRLLSLIFSLPLLAQSGPFTNRWNGNRPISFAHVISDAPGRITLTLDAKMESPGVETVAVYLGTAARHKTDWRLFVVASSKGSSATKSFTLPKPKKGTLSKASFVVIVENASHHDSAGVYTLTVNR
jgi:hypothetical protein